MVLQYGKDENSNEPSIVVSKNLNRQNENFVIMTGRINISCDTFIKHLHRKHAKIYVKSSLNCLEIQK